MEKKKTLDVRIPNMNLVPKWAFLGLKLKKKVDLENEAHFEVFFQIYPSMLENFTGVSTISNLVSPKENSITFFQAKNSKK